MSESLTVGIVAVVARGSNPALTQISILKDAGRDGALQPA
jgi:hypothetical protein